MNHQRDRCIHKHDRGIAKMEILGLLCFCQFCGISSNHNKYECMWIMQRMHTASLWHYTRSAG